MSRKNPEKIHVNDFVPVHTLLENLTTVQSVLTVTRERQISCICPSCIASLKSGCIINNESFGHIT